MNAPTVPGTSNPSGGQAHLSRIGQGARASSIRDWSLLGAITALAAFLSLHSLGAKSFWLDEGVSVAVARLDWYNFGRILWRREANMSLYYLLLRPWLYLGSSESLIRSLSVVFGLLSIVALYFLGRRLFDSRVALLASGLMAVNAYYIRYCQEARSYTLMLLLCVLSSFYFLQMLEAPSRRNRIAYILTSVLAVYAHFFSGLLLLAHWLSLLFLDRQRIPTIARKNWGWIALLALPIAVFVAATGSGPLRWIQRPGLADLRTLALRMTGNGGPVLLAGYVIACLAALWPAFRGHLAQRTSWDSWRYRFLLIWLLFPVLFTIALSFIKPLFLARYFFFCLPALMLLAASGLSRIRPAWLAMIAVLVVAGLSLRGTASYYQRDFDLRRSDWREISQYLLANAKPGDALIFHIAMSRLPYEYYHSLQGAAGNTVYVMYPNHGDRITFLDFVEKPDYAQIQDSLPKYSRVWLVLSNAKHPDGLDATATSLVDLLETSYSKADARDFTGVGVTLYTRGDPGSPPAKQ